MCFFRLDFKILFKLAVVMSNSQTKCSQSSRFNLNHNRFSDEDGWRLCDISLSVTGNIAVSGDNYKTRRTFIDVYSLRNLDPTNTPKIQFSKEFGEYSSAGKAYYGLFVSFVKHESNSLVTGIGNKIEVIETINGQIRSSSKLNGWVSSITVKGKDVYVAFKHSNRIIVVDVTELTNIRLIVIEEIQDNCLFTDLVAVDERLLVCTYIKSANKNRMLVIEEKNGHILHELQSPDVTRLRSYPLSVTLNAPLGFMAIVWSYFVDTEHKEFRETVLYSVSEEHPIFLVVENDPNVSRIRIYDKENIMITGNEWTGDVKIYDMADLYSYRQLKDNLMLRLLKEECSWLVKFFALSKDQGDAILKSNSPTESLLLALEEKGAVMSPNVERLVQAFREMNTNLFCFNVTNIYQETRVQATLYEQFLATLSAHLTGSVPADLCDYFHISHAKKEKIMSSQNSGLSLLLLLDEMGTIDSRDVKALYQPFTTFQLVQAVAKVEEHHEIIEQEINFFQTEAGITSEERRQQFIQCLRRRIKSWYETMTPVPWKKSCRWRSEDLFVGSGLILTDSKAKGNLLGIDEKCKLEYTEIFNHERLKSEARIILEGDPGSGKTMVMSQLAYDWSQGKFSEIEILIFLPLKIVQQKTLAEAVKEFYHVDENHVSVNGIEGFLQNEDNTSYLLLDGLEEYTGQETKAESNEVMEIMSKVKYSTCTVLLSTRTGYAHMLPKYPMLKLGRFGEMERNSYIEKLFPGDYYKQMKIQTAICNSPFMLGLCATPLLFVLTVHNIESAARSDKVEIDRVSPFMQSMVNTLISSYTSTDEIDQDSDGTSIEYGMEHLRKALECAEENTSDAKELSWEKLQGRTRLSEQASPGEHKLLEGEKQAEDEENLTEDLSDGKEPSLNLDKLAFNGLCGGIQQLLWQREFLEKNLINSKMWIDSGILVIEEGLLTFADNKEHQERQTEREPENEPFLSDVKDAQGRKSMQDTPRISTEQGSDHASSEIPEGLAEIVQHDEDEGPYVVGGSFSECGEENDSLFEYQLHIEPSETDILNTEHKSDRILKQVSLQVRFLHKLIQEWFAARHLSALLWKSVDSNELQKRLYEHMPFISPTDLHYLLRFTCFLCPPSLHFIVKYLLQTYRLEEGDLKNNVMNCIFLCFAEYIGKTDLDVLETIAVLCQENITVNGEDSRLLQKSKVFVLEQASCNGIPVKSVLLADILESATDDALMFNSGVKMAVMDTLQHLQIIRWDQKLHEGDCVVIMRFLSKCVSMKEVRIYLPLTPPELDKEMVNTIHRMETRVTWILGPKVIQTLDTTTGTWTITSNAKDEDDMKSSQFTTAYDVQARPTLRVASSISKHGGFLQIPGTDVSLNIPPGALDEYTKPFLIEIGIIPCNYEETSASFSSNSSVTVELLPNNLRLQKPVQLTLPHCLQLKKNEKRKARIFMSHHEGNAEPRWQETCQRYVLDDKMCTIWLQNFCWTKYEIDDEIVEAKKLVIFTAAKPLSLPEYMAEIEVGYHLDLPGPIEFLQLNPAFILAQRKSFLFLKKGKHSLRLSLDRIIPRTWRHSSSDEDPKTFQEIPFAIVASSMEHSCGFLLFQDTLGYDSPICTFIASQEGNVLQQKINIRPETTEQPWNYPAAELQPQAAGHSDPFLNVLRLSKSDKMHQVTGKVVDSSKQLVPVFKFNASGREPLLQQPGTRDCSKTEDKTKHTQTQRTANQPETGSSLPKPQQLQNPVDVHSQLTACSRHGMLDYRRLQVPGILNPVYQQYHYSQVFCVNPYNLPLGGNYMPYEEHSEGGSPIRYGLVNAIAKKLNPTDSIGNDWKQLADKLGFKMDDISMFESAPNATYALIDCAVKQGRLKSPQQLKTMLEEMGRLDAASVIEQYDCDI